MRKRNVFGRVVSLNEADAMVCGLTRSYAASLESINYVLDPIPNKTILGMTVMLCNGRTIFVADQTYMICKRFAIGKYSRKARK